MDTPFSNDLSVLTDDPSALVKLALDLLVDAIPGTPARVVSVLAEANFDTAEAARRLGKGPHYVHTNVGRFVAQARQVSTHDRAIRLLVAVIFSCRAG